MRLNHILCIIALFGSNSTAYPIAQFISFEAPTIINNNDYTGKSHKSGSTYCRRGGSNSNSCSHNSYGNSNHGSSTGHSRPNFFSNSF